MAGRGATVLRILKPIVAGMAVAYVVTAFVDKPSPVHFQPENPYASKQGEVAEPQADLVLEQNVMKLGSPLSVRPTESVSEANPLAILESETVETSVTVSDNGTAGESAIRGGIVTLEAQ